MASASRRLTVSCDDCRQRKIRCQSWETQAACDTCIRRGYEATCTFRRQSVSQIPESGGELSRQLFDLSCLLKQNIKLTTASLDRDRNAQALATPESQPAEGVTSVESDDTTAQVFPTGRLLVSTSNHVQCIPFNRVGDGKLLDSMQEPVCNPLAGFPFSIGDPGTRQELLDYLPSLQHCDRLKDIFLSVFSPLFHILHEPTFETKYREFKQEPRSAPLSFLALLFVIFSLAATSLDDENPLLAEMAHNSKPSANVLGLAATYRLAAMKCLSADDFMSQHNLCTLQSLVLLAYAVSHAGGPMWSLLGFTLHIAIAIGCSVDPDQLDVDIIEAEERRRCWAALMMLYTIQCTCFGNIMPFRIRANVALPANVDDEELFGVTRSSLQSSPQRLTQMSYLLCKFNLYNIAFEICRLFSSASLPPRDQVLKLDQQLGMELKKHTSLFENVTDMPFYHVAHFYIVSNYTQHLQLLLHRPYIGAIDSTSSREPLEAQIRESYQRCNDSAMKILSNFESFHHSTQMRPYRWYINGFGSFQAFMAVTTLLVIMANRDIAPTSNLAMTTAIRSCMSIFRELSRKSEICAKALAVLERSGDTRISEFQQATFGNPSFPTPPVSMPGCAASDTWNYFPDMETFIRDIPSEQWLFPSGFPWGNLRSI